MTKKVENSFILGVHGWLKTEHAAAPYVMKNHNEYVGGIADCWYSGPCRDLWVEYKFIVLPTRMNTLIVPDLSTLQRQWLRNRQEEGRNVWVIVGCKQGGVILPKADMWEKGLSTTAFLGSFIPRRDLANAIERFTCHK